MNKKIKIFFYIFLIVLINSSLKSDITKQAKLNELFLNLKIAENLKDAKKIEYKIWDLWSEHDKDRQLTKWMTMGTKQMSNGDYLSAYSIFSNIIKKDPKWAEGWNKRATVLFLMGKYEKSLNDIDKTLNIEKKHFGALTGRGLIYINLNKYEKAIESYKAAQKIYPLIESGEMIIEIKKLMRSSQT